MAKDGYGTADEDVPSERKRLNALSQTRDRRTLRLIDRIGITEGSVCLEVGAGTGSVSRCLAQRVGSGGRVLSVDKDLRFHEAMPSNVEVRELDLVTGDIPVGHFDFVHTRAVLQHIPERDEVFARLAAATKPGGHLLVEDSDMRAFAEQPLPEPFATVHRLVATGAMTPWRDPNFGTKLLSCFLSHGFGDLGMDGAAGIMYPRHPSGEWWLLALDRVVGRLVDAGTLTDEQARACRTQMRGERMVMIGPLMLAVWGRRAPPA